MRQNLEVKIPSDDETIDIFLFAKHVFGSWCGLMTGGVIGAGLLIYSILGVIPVLLFGLVGIVAIFVACFHLWRAERENKLTIIAERNFLENSLTSEIKQLKDDKEKNTPKLLVERDWVSVAKATLSNSREGTSIIVQVSIRNIGIPSIVKDWHIFLRLHTGEEFTTGYTHSLKPIVMNSDVEDKIELTNQDAIYTKTTSPIQTGAMVSGFLHFFFPFEFHEVKNELTVATLFFRDVLDCEYSLKINDFATAISDSQIIGYYPGVNIKRTPTAPNILSRKSKKKPRNKRS